MKPWSILFLVIAGLTILTLAIAWGDSSSSLQVKAPLCQPKAPVTTCKNV